MAIFSLLKIFTPKFSNNQTQTLYYQLIFLFLFTIHLLCHDIFKNLNFLDTSSDITNLNIENYIETYGPEMPKSSILCHHGLLRCISFCTSLDISCPLPMYSFSPMTQKQPFADVLENRCSACNFIKKRLQHSCFTVNIAKCLRTAYYRTPPLCFTKACLQNCCWVEAYWGPCQPSIMEPFAIIL